MEEVEAGLDLEVPMTRAGVAMAVIMEEMAVVMDQPMGVVEVLEAQKMAGLEGQQVTLI